MGQSPFGRASKFGPENRFEVFHLLTPPSQTDPGQHLHLRRREVGCELVLCQTYDTLALGVILQAWRKTLSTKAQPNTLRLWLPDQDQAVSGFEEVNRILAEVGSAAWPLETGSAPDDILQFLAMPLLDEYQSQRVMDHFLLSRERLMELVVAAGRIPGTEGGGSLSTTDKTHSVVYPQLYQVVESIDYSRFDRFHVNRSLTQTGVDEVMQVLCGRGVVLQQQIPDRGEFRLEIDCAPGKGWTLTYDGDLPHIGSISGASPGAKILMQVFGPAEWEMQYL